MANRETLQKNLNANYDLEFFQRNVLHPVFGNSLTLASIPEKRNINASEERLIKSVKKYGTITLADYRELDLYDVELAENVVIERSKVSIGAAIKKYIFANNAVLVNFHYENQPAKSWRLSFIAKEQQIEEGEIVKGETNPKRYTYVLGQNETCRTAAERFTKLSLDAEFTIDKFKEAFSVEKLSKTFFDEYKEHYLHFVEHLGKRNFKATVFNGDEKAIRDFAKKLLGRIVFLYFVQKKSWLGASSNKYNDGSTNFLEELFIASGKNENFYNAWLKKLFYDSLNNPNRTNENFKMPDGKIVKIPFLNGGLFEDDDPKGILTFPPKLFTDLFEFFKQYNFTIYEDSPDDHTVAVDPEMLGHIFENLLEDNKDKGAFYTPKEIVHYMCQESLIEYLSTKLSIADTTTFQQLGKEQTEFFGNDGKKGQLAITHEHKNKSTGITREDVEQFIKHKQVTDEIKNNAKDINKHLDTIKICDPAIGSGAFPMGLLHEIFNAKLVLNSETGINAAEVKQNIIQNSIYGVDIEQGAVDIARLRFWLSLIVDEDKPRPLPNLDYKIVVGDSLVPKFEGEVVDIDWDLRDAVGEAKPFVEKIKSGLNEIVEAQKKFFSEENPDKKKKFSEKIRNLKIDLLTNQLTFDKLKYKAKNSISQQLFEQTNKDRQRELEIKMKIAGYDDTIKKLQVLKSKPTKPLKFFDWKLDFPEIVNPVIAKESHGFDIVIGNPPYGANIDKDAVFFQQRFIKVAKNYLDIYKCFYEIGFSLLKNRSALTLITPNTYVSQPRYTDLRTYLLNMNILKINNLGMNVFESAVVPTAIFFGRNESSLKNFIYIDSSKNSKFVSLDNPDNTSILFADEIQSSSDLSFLNTKSKFALSFDDVFEIKDGGIQYHRSGIGLKNKGGNDLYERLFSEKKSHFKKSIPTLYGKKINAYYIDKNADEYFNKDYKTVLKSKESVSFTSEAFETIPKILWRQTASKPIATIDYDGFWFRNTIQCCWIKNDYENLTLEFCLGIINSQFIGHSYNKIVSEAGRVFPQVKIGQVKKLPFVLPTKEVDNYISIRVRKLLSTNSEIPNRKLIDEIDLMVYKLYQLTYDEVLTVDKEFEKQMSREEYEKKDFGFEYVQPNTTVQAKTNGKKKGNTIDMLKDLEL